MDAVARALFAGSTLFVSEYIALFHAALVGEFNLEDPARRESVYLLGLYVGPQNKRHIVLYFGIGYSRNQILRVARVDYTLPVPAAGARVFGGNGASVLPAEGPTFQYLPEPEDPGFIDFAHAIAADVDASVARGPRDRIVPWGDEITRLEEVHRDDKAELERLQAGVSSSSRHTNSEEDSVIRNLKKRIEIVHNVLYFWRSMRRDILLQVSRADIIMPGGATPKSPTKRIPRRFARRASTSNVRAPVLSGSSNRSHHRRIRPTVAVTVRRSRNPRVIPRDPITGKIIRRRQAYSDPRATTTNITEPPVRSGSRSGGRSGYEGSSNTSRGRSPEPTPNTNNNTPIILNLFSPHGTA